MKSQRTFFFYKKPASTPKKDGENKLVPNRRFRAPKPDSFDIRFSNTTVTQFGGYALWNKFCHEIGLNQKLARHIRMARGPQGFTAPELARFLLDSKVLNAERLMHVETMRLDPLLCECAGIDGLASGKTLGVYLKQHGDHHRRGLDNLMVSMNSQLWKRCRRQRTKIDRQKMDRVILDYDSSTFTVYGKQEGADRGRCFRKKEKPGFQPRFGFIGGLGITVHQELLPQSHNLNQDFLHFHEETIRRLPKGAKVWAVRGDGALFSEKHIEYFESRGLIYGISAPMNGPLVDAVLKIPEDQWQEGENESGHPVSIARIHYCPKTWKVRERTFIISRRLRPNPSGQSYLIESEKYKYFAYITNFRGDLENQFRFCIERCTLEANIKEYKADFDYDFLPCQELGANKAYVGYVALARNLSIFFRLITAPPTVNRWRMATFQARILRVCGNLRRAANRWIVSLPVWWPYQTVMGFIMERCAAMAPL
jgi:hypothetical protein